MKSISAHNFTNSPVEEVLCSFKADKAEPSDKSNLVLVTPAPYPGWSRIQKQVDERLKEAEKNGSATVSECCLIYKDKFHLCIEDKPSDFFRFAMPDHGHEFDICMKSELPESTASIHYSECISKNILVTLTFTIKSAPNFEFDSNEALLWFDGAHAEIHRFFDASVSEKLLLQLR